MASTHTIQINIVGNSASATASLRQVNSNLAGIGTSAAKASSGIAGLSGSFVKMGATVARAMILFSAFSKTAAEIKKLFKVNQEFEQSMASVKSVVEQTSGFTIGAFRDMQEEARRLGATTRFTATQAAEGLLFLGRAGFTAEQATQSLEATLRLAQAGAMDLGNAADIVTNIMTAFGAEASKTSEFVDVLALTAASSNTTVEQLAQAMKFAAPAAHGFGQSVQETAAAIGVLGDAGLQSCYDDKTEVLTDDGWVMWKDLDPKSKVATIDPDTHKMWFEVPSKHVRVKYSGDMYRVQTRGVDISVTPNHRMHVKLRGKDYWETLRADELGIKPATYETSCMWEGTIGDSIYIPGFDQNRASWVKRVPGVRVATSLWAKFLGYYLSEGSCYIHKKKGYEKGGTYKVHISQNYGHKRDIMREDLKKLPWGFYEEKGGFVFTNEQLYRQVEQLGKKAPSKVIPSVVHDFKVKNIREFLEAFKLGDGDKNFALTTSSPYLADGLSVLAIKAGWTSTVRRIREKGDKFKLGDRTLTATCPGWKINIRRSYLQPTVNPYDYTGKHGKRYGNKSGSKGAKGIWWGRYDGFVYCATVSTGLLMVRRKGKAVVCGNTLGGTGIRVMLAELGDSGGKASKVMDRLGISFNQINPKFNSLTDITQRLKDAGFGIADAYEAFGKRGGGAAAVLIANSDRFKELTKANNEAEGASRKMANTMDDTVQGAIKRANSAWEEMLLQVGSGGLNDAVRDTSEEFARFITQLNESGELKEFGNDLAKSFRVVSEILSEVGPMLFNIFGAIKDAAFNILDPFGFLEGRVDELQRVEDKLRNITSLGNFLNDVTILTEGVKTQEDLDRIINSIGDRIDLEKANGDARILAAQEAEEEEDVIKSIVTQNKINLGFLEQELDRTKRVGAEVIKQFESKAQIIKLSDLELKKTQEAIALENKKREAVIDTFKASEEAAKKLKIDSSGGAAEKIAASLSSEGFTNFQELENSIRRFRDLLNAGNLSNATQEEISRLEVMVKLRTDILKLKQLENEEELKKQELLNSTVSDVDQELKILDAKLAGNKQLVAQLEKEALILAEIKKLEEAGLDSFGDATLKGIELVEKRLELKDKASKSVTSSKRVDGGVIANSLQSIGGGGGAFSPTVTPTIGGLVVTANKGNTLLSGIKTILEKIESKPGSSNLIQVSN